MVICFKIKLQHRMTYERQELALPVLELGWILNMIFFKKKVKEVPFSYIYFQQTIWKRRSGTVHEPCIQVDAATRSESESLTVMLMISCVSIINTELSFLSTGKSPQVNK